MYKNVSMSEINGFNKNFQASQAVLGTDGITTGSFGKE